MENSKLTKSRVHNFFRFYLVYIILVGGLARSIGEALFVKKWSSTSCVACGNVGHNLIRLLMHRTEV